MKRSVGVTVIAVLSLTGSILTFLMGVLMLVVMALAPPNQEQFPVSPAVFRLMLVLAAMVYILPAIWGIITSVGLFRLSNWARISVIVFSVLLILMGGFSGLMSMLMPLAPPAGSTPALMSSIRAAMAVFWLTLLAIGIWWSVFLTRPRVKQQFGALPSPLGPLAPEIFAGEITQPPILPTVRLASERPLSLTVIAWLLLIGCFFTPLTLILHLPAILLTKMVTGWAAGLYYVGLAAISLYVGMGLLRFKPLARSVGVVYYFFFLINTAVFYLAPGGRSRMRALLDAQSTMFPWMRYIQGRPELQFDATPALLAGGVTGLVCIAIPLYFLMTRKQAFEAAAAIRQTSGSPRLT